MINFQSITTFQGKSLRFNYSYTVLDSILKICSIWNSRLNFLSCVIFDVGTSCHVLWETMSWKRWAFGHWGKKERGGWSFVHANCKRNILIGWEHLYVNQMSWLSLKGKIDWKIEREKQYFHIVKNFQCFVMPYTSNSLPHYCAEKAKRWSHLVPALFCAGTILKQNGNPQDPV